MSNVLGNSIVKTGLKWTAAIVVTGTFTYKLKRPAGIPHSYKIVTELGSYPNLAVDTVMKEVQLGNLFPLEMRGTLGEQGQKALLNLQGTQCVLPSNEVELVSKTETEDHASILLKATEGEHLFKGTADHIIDKDPNGKFTYTVEGKGIEGEENWRKFLNLTFAQYMWPALIKLKVKPGVAALAKKHVDKE